MDSKYRTKESWFRLLNAKLDYVIGKLDSESTEDTIEAPLAPPPDLIPEKSQDKDNPLKPCEFKYTYLWLKNHRSFWAYLTSVGNHFVSGYRWNGTMWVTFRVNFRLIDAFVCYDE